MYDRLKKFGKWGELHEESELLAMDAERLRRTNPSKAREVSLKAAKIEEESLGHIPWEKPVEMYEAIVVSAAVLYFKGGDYTGAQRVLDNYSEKVTMPHPKMRLEEVVEALTKMN